MQNILLTIAITALSFAVFAQDSTIYRWVDSNNVVHFSHEHPNDRDYAQVDIQVSYEPTDDFSEKATLTEEKPDNEQVPTDIEISKQSAEVIKQNCESAKVNLKILSGFEKILYKNPEGESRILSEEEKQEQLILSEKYFDVYCEQENAKL